MTDEAPKPPPSDGFPTDMVVSRSERPHSRQRRGWPEWQGAGERTFNWPTPLAKKRFPWRNRLLWLPFWLVVLAGVVWLVVHFVF